MEETKKLKVDIKEILKVVGLLYFILILVGILTYVLKPSLINGANPDGTLDITWLTETTRVPWYRWLTAPIECLIFDKGKVLMYEVIAMILGLGGCFKVLEECGCMSAIIKVIISKLKKNRFIAVVGISIFMMLLTSFFGVQDELLILFPICLSFANAMGWNKTTALALVLITTGVGFTCAIFNPLTIGICTTIARVSIFSGIWFRIIVFILMATVTSFYMIWMCKRDEKALELNKLSEEEQSLEEVETTDEEKLKAILTTILFGFVIVVLILFSAVPALEKLGLSLIVMAASFIIGTIVICAICEKKKFYRFFTYFWHGIKAIGPSIFVVVTAFSIKYLADQANILHTIFYYIYGLFGRFSPYFGVIILLFFILILEFFIPSASAKAGLIMPILTVVPIPGISVNVIILAYLFGDGYANVVFPTCGTLMIGLGVANVSYIEWIKKTGLFQLFLLATSIIFLIIAVAIGL